MRAHPSKRWWKVKAEIMAQWGTLSACANEIGCSTESLRQAAAGNCPGVWSKLQTALGKRKAVLA